jgi:hypothetical protein
MTSEEPAVPKPSYLPPNPSVGELVTEIDRARHEAARTMTALVAKLDVQTRVRQKTALRLNGRKVAALRTRVVDATPEPVTSALGTAIDYAKRVPVPARILLAVVLLRWFSARRRR